MVTFTVDQLIELRSSLSDALYYSASGPKFGVAPTMQLEKTTIYEDDTSWAIIASATGSNGFIDLIVFDEDNIDPWLGTKPEIGKVIGKFNTERLLERVYFIVAIESWLFDSGYGVLLSGVWRPAESFTTFVREGTTDYLVDLFNLMIDIADNCGLTFREHPHKTNLFGFWPSDLK